MKTIKKRLLTSVLCAGVLSIGLVSTAHATLESRLGGLAYYDTDLNITWAANANINGFDTWDNQQTWVSGLSIGGIGGWRLASADVNGDNNVVNCFGGGVTGCSDNEMGYLFWEENITGASSGVFNNVQSFFYWSGTEFAPNPVNAWDFHFSHPFLVGNQDAIFKGNNMFAWAVHSGDVGASSVPEPGTIALLGLGLVGLLSFGRRLRRR